MPDVARSLWMIHSIAKDDRVSVFEGTGARNNKSDLLKLDRPIVNMVRSILEQA